MANKEIKTKIIKKNIPFSPPDISELEVAEVCDALRSGWITTGPRTKELEKRLAEYCHTSKVVCLNSATASEELNFRICGIGKGDEVIVPAYTYTATATLLLPAGITSEASIRYKDEAKLLDSANDVDNVYVEKVLPGKMRYNLESIKKFSFCGDIATMFRTVFAVLGKDYK